MQYWWLRAFTRVNHLWFTKDPFVPWMDLWSSGNINFDSFSCKHLLVSKTWSVLLILLSLPSRTMKLLLQWDSNPTMIWWWLALLPWPRSLQSVKVVESPLLILLLHLHVHLHLQSIVDWEGEEIFKNTMPFCEPCDYLLSIIVIGIVLAIAETRKTQAVGEHPRLDTQWILWTLDLAVLASLAKVIWSPDVMIRFLLRNQEIICSHTFHYILCA